MLEVIAQLAEWAIASNSAVAWLLALNLASLFVLIFWLTRYQPRLTKFMRTLQAGQKALEEKHEERGEAIVAALQATTDVLHNLAGLLSISATGQAARPILLTLDGVGSKVDKIERTTEQLGEAVDELSQTVGRIERMLLAKPSSAAG